MSLIQDRVLVMFKSYDHLEGNI